MSTFVIDESRAREHLNAVVSAIIADHDARDVTITDVNVDVSNEGWAYSYRYDRPPISHEPTRQTVTITIRRVPQVRQMQVGNQLYRTNALYCEVLRAREMT